MKKAIYLRLLAITLAAVFICGLISAVIYAVYSQNQTKEWLTKLTVSAVENYHHDADIAALVKAAGGSRITIIAPDGSVKADSELSEGEPGNYLNHDEVLYAKTGSVYINVRDSAAFGKRFMYASIQAEDGNIIRLSHDYSGMLQNLAVQFPAVLAAVLSAFILSLLLAGRFTKTVTAPLEKMVEALSVREYGLLNAYSSPYYEIEKIIQSLQELLWTISRSNKQLQNEREKIQAVLSNMAEGFILVDDKENVLLCNNSARAFFACHSGIKLENIYQITRNRMIKDALRSAIEERISTSFDMTLQGSLVHVYVSPSKTADNESGAIILIMDISAEKLLEQQKRDFFSNASHELKTPITSILGFSEMLCKDIVQDEKEKAEIISRISMEAKRMSALIIDILTISELESNGEREEYAEVPFKQIVLEAAASVTPVMEDAGITMNMDLEDFLFRANRRRMYELCVNLIENAVKYNKPDGRVDISLKLKGKQALLVISDTGIGIPPEYQSRVFERFFRVDYGRDKKIGGTGLGLSIVKHIVSVHGGHITLQSKKDEGTTITVSLPV
ncbi:MAG: ATP-binding protein [Clostridia bacterium]|nr:ATP-binding protein [Clostridia bacterium]